MCLRYSDVNPISLAIFYELITCPLLFSTATLMAQDAAADPDDWAGLNIPERIDRWAEVARYCVIIVC